MKMILTLMKTNSSTIA